MKGNVDVVYSTDVKQKLTCHSNPDSSLFEFYVLLTIHLDTSV